MQVQVTLYGMFRQKLPPELHGKAVLNLQDGATLLDILNNYEITNGVICSVNGKVQPDTHYLLQDGDQIQLFQPSHGG